MSFEGPKSEGVLKVKWFDVVIICCSALAAFALLAVEIVTEFNFNSKASLSLKFWTFSLYLGISMLLIQLTIQVVKRRKMKLFLRKVHEFDQEASDYYFK